MTPLRTCLAAVTALLLLLSPLASQANDEGRVVGPVSDIMLAPDGKSASAQIRDSKSGEMVKLRIADDETLEKFKDKRIQEGDEVRARFDRNNGENLSKFFRRTSGC
jgi:hypothetical protein